MTTNIFYFDRYFHVFKQTLVVKNAEGPGYSVVWEQLTNSTECNAGAERVASETYFYEKFKAINDHNTYDLIKEDRDLLVTRINRVLADYESGQEKEMLEEIKTMLLAKGV